MHLAILRTGQTNKAISDSFPDYPEMFARLLNSLASYSQYPRFTFTSFAVFDGELPAHIDDFDGYLLTGSAAGVYETHSWLEPLFAFIRACDAAKKPICGICFGHQAVAKALGGEVVKWPDGWGVGVRPTRFEREPVPKAELPDDAVVKLIYFHQDQVTRLPEGAERLASSDFCDEAGFTLCTTDGVQTVLCLQGHPEFDAGYSTALLDSIESKVGTDRTKAARATLAKKTDSPLVAGWIKQFFTTSVQRRGWAA